MYFDFNLNLDMMGGRIELIQDWIQFYQTDFKYASIKISKNCSVIFHSFNIHSFKHVFYIIFNFPNYSYIPEPILFSITKGTPFWFCCYCINIYISGDLSSGIEEPVPDHLGRQRSTLGGQALPGVSQSTNKVFYFIYFFYLQNILDLKWLESADWG